MTSGCLHIDDNTAIFLQYNDEKDLIDFWRTALPFGIRARETPHFLAFVKGVASDSFYTKFEALCDGIIDVKAQGGRRHNWELHQGSNVERKDFRFTLASNSDHQ
jgi:hypothetical protein